jgi:hypothetical protein
MQLYFKTGVWEWKLPSSRLHSTTICHLFEKVGPCCMPCLKGVACTPVSPYMLGRFPPIWGAGGSPGQCTNTVPVFRAPCGIPPGWPAMVPF